MLSLVCILGGINQPPLTPDREMSKNSTPSLKSTCYLPVFYGLSHGITFEKNGMAQNLIYLKI